MTRATAAATTKTRQIKRASPNCDLIGSILGAQNAKVPTVAKQHVEPPAQQKTPEELRELDRQKRAMEVHFDASEQQRVMRNYEFHVEQEDLRRRAEQKRTARNHERLVANLRKRALTIFGDLFEDKKRR
ncbi:unnamed protein product [Caenorhabditis sp. 36 PRJEB53466]|nr:unnamed protein product [Caenorhabditis sp. 36 PRJEB53466]